MGLTTYAQPSSSEDSRECAFQEAETEWCFYLVRVDIPLQSKSCSMGDPHSVLFRPSQVTVLPTAKSNQRKKARHLAAAELGMGVIFRCKDLPMNPSEEPL